MPLPDGDYQFEHFIGLLFLLRSFFSGYPDVSVKGNTMLYYVEGDAGKWLSPDCYVAFGVDLALLRENNNYRVWDMGKAPDFVLEIGSPSTWRNDLEDKRDIYAGMGVGEYWLFDPSGGDHYGFALRGETLVDGEYRPLDMREDAEGGTWGHSPTLNLEFHWVGGILRVYDPVGERWLPTPDELVDEREAERARAEFAEVRAESERLARQSAEARADALEAELRRLRGQQE